LNLKRIKAVWLPQYIGGNVKLIGWPITQKEVWTKDGLTMSFLSFEDETGMYETVIFPQVYDRHHTLLFDQRPLIVYGRVMSDFQSADHGAITVEVSRIDALTWITETMI
jgi:DNA polymerase-3 subunit alpha/error-prone DNA polymerase